MPWETSKNLNQTAFDSFHTWKQDNINYPKPNNHYNPTMNPKQPSSNKTSASRFKQQYQHQTKNDQKQHYNKTPYRNRTGRMSQSTEENTTDHTLPERKSLVVPMNNNHDMENRIRLARCLLGTIKDSKTFTPERVQNYVDSCWLVRGIVNVEKRGSIFLFSFTNNEDMDVVISRSPLNINGAVLLLAHWTPNIVFQHFEISYVGFWIQLHGIPGEFFSEENIRRMARIAGQVSVIDWNSDNSRALRTVRALVRIPVHEPIVPGVFILTPERTRLRVSFRYEKNFRVCYHCGRIGHSYLHCDFTDEEANTGYMEHLINNNMDRRYEVAADFDAHLFNHWIRGLPNS